MKPDIQNRADIEVLINAFYAQVVKDELISTFFNEIAPVNWERHLPIMIGFWEFILFSTPDAYKGSVMEPHFHLHKLKALEGQHFERWLKLFAETVDSLYEGPKAEDAKQAARNIGATMKYKIIGSARSDSGISISKID